MQVNSVDDYISNYPENVQKLLKEMRRLIKKTAPDTQELISYRMPAYKFNGKYLVFFAAFKNHIGFFPLPESIEKFKKELSIYHTAKGSIQFPLDKPFS